MLPVIVFWPIFSLQEPFPLGVNVRIRPGKLRNCGSEENRIQGNSSTLASAEEFASGIHSSPSSSRGKDWFSLKHQQFNAAWHVNSIIVYLYFLRVCVWERRVGAACTVRGAHNFGLIEEPWKSFWRSRKVHNQNEVKDSSVFFIYQIFCDENVLKWTLLFTWQWHIISRVKCLDTVQ
jgi:hypothetical protein